MKARPRSVENKVADYLSAIFTALDLSPVERIPILGRTGPDISINETKLVIDVKSRKEVPQTLFMPLDCPFFFYGKNSTKLLGVRLEVLGEFLKGWPIIASSHFSSVIVDEYLAHMDEWRKEVLPEGVSMIVLHRPREPIGNCVAVIYFKDYGRLCTLCQKKQQP